LSLTLTTAVLAVTIVASGTAVQGSLGFGLALIAAPLLFLIDPVFVPGPMMVVALALSSCVAWTERHAIVVTHLKSAFCGRLIGSLLAALLLGLVSARTFDLLFGMLVLVAVATSLVHPRVEPRTGTVFTAMFASGVMGTLSGIDGPPLALLYQHNRGPALRANLAVLFLMGSLLSLAALVAVGRFGLPELRASALLLLGVAPGYWCAGLLKPHLDRRNARPYLLGLCAFTALLVVGRAAFAFARS
jgi:uncharacterized membrane protein YfcA